MVVGKGLIASNFSDFLDRDDILIFASGVSNSQETSQAAYDREIALIKDHLHSHSLFVYFSSVSVMYPCLQNNKYVQFKQHIEDYIRNQMRESVVFRLPNLVGRTTNPHTLTNFIYNCIQSGEHFDVHANATRYLLDVEHMSKICSSLLINAEFESVCNVVLDNQISIQDIVHHFELITGKKGNYTVVDKGCSLDIEPLNAPLLQTALNFSADQMGDYNLEILRKYYGHHPSL